MRDGPNQSVFLNPIANLIAIHAKQRRRTRLIAAATLEGLDDETALERFEVNALSRQVERARGGARRAEQREVRQLEKWRLGEEHGALNRVTQLTHVARPAVALQGAHRSRGQATHFLAEFPIEAINVEADERRYVLEVLA